jgi:hypothetical protein
MDQDIDPIDIENIRDSQSSSLPSDPGSERQAYQANSPNRSLDLGSEPEIPLQIVD